MHHTLYKEANERNNHPNGCFCQQCFVIAKVVEADQRAKKRAAAREAKAPQAQQ